VYVCICKGITQKQVEEAIAVRKGQSAKNIMRALGIGSDCGHLCGRSYPTNVASNKQEFYISTQSEHILTITRVGLSYTSR